MVLFAKVYVLRYKVFRF